ncbi:MAG: stage V sporulation protein AC [Clostridia bacterium]|nr:stage V sporulation protein AC [Clostridia bacterium]
MASEQILNSPTLSKNDKKKAYFDLVNRNKPKPPLLRNIFWAFVIGGLISVIGQGLLILYSGQGLDEKSAGAATSATLVFAAALLTGLGVYDNIGKFAGAGSIVPITGFANSMVASALEWKREGMVFGVGAKLFAIAGPVLVYGFVTSWLIGLIAFIFKG